MKIGVIGAMDAEIAILLDEMKKTGDINKTKCMHLAFYEGKIAGKDIVLVKSGIGKVNAALCADRLILQFKVDEIINTGVAGALGGDLCIFDMAVSESAVYHDMDAREFGYKATEIPQMGVSEFLADKTLIEIAKNAFAKVNTDANRKLVAGKIATGDQFVASRGAKEYIKSVCSPICVEMEGAAIAHACYLSETPYVILRCISDMADDTVKATYSFNEETAAKDSSRVVLEMIKEI